MKIKENYRQKLLVEGNDDQHVIWSLCEKHHLAHNFDVIDCNSIENVFKRFDLSINENASTVDVVSIVVDADVDVAKRWAYIKRLLDKTTAYSCPDALPQSGLVLKPNVAHKPVVGVWIMPTNHTDGMLEDFVALLAHNEDKMLACVDATLADMECRGITKYKPIHKAKARIHTFLAWQEDPGTPMGLAITKKYVNPHSDNCTPFINWLIALFDA